MNKLHIYLGYEALCQPRIRDRSCALEEENLIIKQWRGDSGFLRKNWKLVGKIHGRSEYKQHTLGVWVFDFAQQDRKGKERA